MNERQRQPADIERRRHERHQRECRQTENDEQRPRERGVVHFRRGDPRALRHRTKPNIGRASIRPGHGSMGE